MAQSYWNIGPNAPVEFYLDDIKESLDTAYKSRRVRALALPEVWALYKRLRSAPRRKRIYDPVGWFEVSLAQDPDAFPEETSWRFVDRLTGRRVIREDDGSLFREAPYPEGAFTAAEMVRLAQVLWESGERAAQAAQAGTLSASDKQAAVELIEAADELDARIALKKLQPESFTEAQEMKERVLRSLAENPGRGPVRRSRGQVTWVKPPKSAISIAQRSLERQKKLPTSKRGGLSKSEAGKLGITSGIARAESIARGEEQPAEDIRDFFNRFKGTYQDAILKGKSWEDSKVQQAWDIWGGTPMWKAALRALEKAPKKKGSGKMPAGFLRINPCAPCVLLAGLNPAPVEPSVRDEKIECVCIQLIETYCGR